MCFSKLLGIFKPRPPVPPVEPPTPPGPPVPEPPTPQSPPLVMPHPEEPADMMATMNTVSIQGTLTAWMNGWQVPASAIRFWQAVHITVAEHLDYDQYPAYSYAELRQLYFHPPFFNKGTLAHENAHVVYALLSIETKAAFEAEYRRLVVSDKLVAYLYQVKALAMYDLKEIYAEVYRYLGQYMPEQLKGFYPHLF